MTTSCTVPSSSATGCTSGCAAGAGPPRMLRAWIGWVMRVSFRGVGRRRSAGGPLSSMRPAEGPTGSERADHHVAGPEPVLAGILVVRAGPAGGKYDRCGDDAAVRAQRL